MRIGYVLLGDKFAAVLYANTTEDALKRSPLCDTPSEAVAYGTIWAEHLQIGDDAVRVDVRFLQGEP